MTTKAKTSKSYYARVLGTMWRHPRTVGLSLAARGLWVTLLSYSADHRTDGRIDPAALRIVASGAEIRRQLAELSAAEMLLAAPGGGWQIRDWSQHNITRDKHEKALENTRNRVAKVRGKVNVSNEARNALPAPEHEEERNPPCNALPSEQDQDQDQDIDPLRGSGAPEADRPEAGQSPEPPSVRDPWPTDQDPTPSELERAAKLSRAREAIAKDLLEGYQRIATESGGRFTVPTWDLSPMSKPIVKLGEAFVGRKDAWRRTVAAFFASSRARDGGFSAHHLASNPNQYLAEADRPGSSAARPQGPSGASAAHGRPELTPNEATAYGRARERARGVRKSQAEHRHEIAALESAKAKGWDPEADERAGWQP